MNKLKATWAIALSLTIACGVFAQSSGQPGSKSNAPEQKIAVVENGVLQACREAVLELKFAREKEALLLTTVEELRKLNSVQADQVEHSMAANLKYEQAIAVRTQAEALVEQLRQNYEKQMAQAEKQLAVANLKTRLWQVLAGVAAVLAVLASSKR